MFVYPSNFGIKSELIRLVIRQPFIADKNIKYKEAVKNKGIPHIIPRFYLEYFCCNTTNKITVYSKKNVPHLSTPYKIAKQRKFYSLEKVPEDHKNLADEVLTIIENGIKATHQQLVECDLNITPVNKIKALDQQINAKIQK